jgi:nucleotide-binding universal stress UspA family protein
MVLGLAPQHLMAIGRRKPMAFKDVLIALTTYPEPTPVSAVDDAVDIAAALGAKISAIACEVKIRAPGSPLGKYLLNIPAILSDEAKKSATNAQQLLVAFQDAAEKRGIFQERISEQCLTSEVPDVFIEYARLRDLTIVPVPEGDYIDQWYAESIIFGSGRPTVVLPHTRKRTGLCKGRGIGDVFEAHVTYRNANLLVMGAYGHSRFREFILGGATKRMLAHPPVPLLLSH